MRPISRFLVFLIPLLLFFGCGQSKGETEGKLLTRIKAVEGDGSKVDAKLGKGDQAKGRIVGIKGSLSHIEGDFTQKALPDKKLIVVSDSNAIKNLNLPPVGNAPCIIMGEFFINENIEVPDGSWDGNKIGAMHTIIGKLTLFDYEFESSKDTPLKFKMTKEGYAYVSGSGSVNDLKAGKTYNIK
jgi:hypothetical protein